MLKATDNTTPFLHAKFTSFVLLFSYIFSFASLYNILMFVMSHVCRHKMHLHIPCRHIQTYVCFLFINAGDLSKVFVIVITRKNIDIKSKHVLLLLMLQKLQMCPLFMQSDGKLNNQTHLQNKY